MKSIVISVLMLSMALIFVSCENEGQPTQITSDSDTQSLTKKQKPPQNPKPELITFTGDLVGYDNNVLGCCPNAGPFPDYTLTLSRIFPEPGTYGGNIFMNTFGKGRNKSYIVQFWTETMFLEVRGGDIQKDKRTKTTTVTFTNEPCVIDGDTVLVSFTLTRVPQ